MTDMLDAVHKLKLAAGLRAAAEKYGHLIVLVGDQPKTVEEICTQSAVLIDQCVGVDVPPPSEAPAL